MRTPRLNALRTEKARDWAAIQGIFREALASTGASIENLVLEVSAESTASPSTWTTWWRRDDAEKRIAVVREGFAKNFITHVGLHGGTSTPGEQHTVRLLCEASAISKELTEAALLFTAKRASQWLPGIVHDKASPDDFRSKLSKWSRGALEDAGIDTYSLSRQFLPVWFHPPLDKVDPDGLVMLLGNQIGQFLREWTPVKVSVAQS